MKIIFLGTNGWFDDDRGKTISTLIETDNEYIILDAGFGIQYAGHHIDKNKPIYLYLSHAHIDHICGLHGLSGFRPKQGMTIMATADVIKKTKRIIASPYTFPLNRYNFPIKFLACGPGAHIHPFEFSIFKMRHIDTAYGIRIVNGGKILSYCCDTAPCGNVVKFSKNADIMIIECSLKKGKKDGEWGHTSPDDAARLAKQAAVKKLYLTHFLPGYNGPADKKEIIASARSIFPSVSAAADGLSIEI